MFFANNKEKKTSPLGEDKPSSNKNASPTIISPDLHVRGDMITVGDMQIDGILEGNVKSGFLGVGPSAVVTGEIEAEDVIIRGKLTGRIRARSVTLTSTARVIGDIWHEVLSIEAGAFLEGHCKHMKSRDSQVNKKTSGDAEAVPLMQPKSQGRKEEGSALEPTKEAV